MGPQNLIDQPIDYKALIFGGYFYLAHKKTKIAKIGDNEIQFRI